MVIGNQVEFIFKILKRNSIVLQLELVAFLIILVSIIICNCLLLISYFFKTYLLIFHISSDFRLEMKLDVESNLNERKKTFCRICGRKKFRLNNNRCCQSDSGNLICPHRECQFVSKKSILLAMHLSFEHSQKLQ